MVKITNGVNVFEVSRGAFEGIYSRQGYTILDEKKIATGGVIPPKALEKTEDEKFLEEIIEKPLSQWNKEEIKRFAALNEIDISGTKNADEARGLIKAFLEEDDED